MEQSSNSKNHFATTIIVSVIFLIVAAAGILGYRILFVKKTPPKTTPSPVVIEAAHPTAAEWRLPFSTFGTVKSYNSVNVSAETDGRITNIVPNKPGIVHKGDLLFQVFNQTQTGGVEAQKSQLTYAKRNLARQHQLLKDGAISKNEYDIALQNYKTALGNVKAAKGSLSLTNIYAPITGTIGIITPSVGDYINSGSVLATINPLTDMYIQFSLPAFLENTVHTGDSISFTNPALGDKEIQATVYEIDNKVDINTRQIILRAAFKNTTPRLLPGEFVTLAIQVGQPKRVLVVPDTSIKYSMMGTSLFKIVNNKTVEIPIKVIQRRNNMVGITSNALTTSDTIVADGTIKVSNGTLVRTLSDHESH